MSPTSWFSSLNVVYVSDHRFGNLQAGAERDRIPSQGHCAAGEQHKGATRHVRGHRHARREPGTFLRSSLHHTRRVFAQRSVTHASFSAYKSSVIFHSFSVIYSSPPPPPFFFFSDTLSTSCLRVPVFLFSPAPRCDRSLARSLALLPWSPVQNFICFSNVSLLYHIPFPWLSHAPFSHSLSFLHSLHACRNPSTTIWS